MSAIIFDSIPIDIRARHDAQGGGSRIHGGYMCYQTVVQALLRHSRADRFFFLSRSKPNEFSLAHHDDLAQDPRVRVLRPSELGELRGVGDAVCMTTTERMGPLLRFRDLLPSHVPAVGFLHAAHPRWIGPILLETSLAGVTSSDAVLCSSRASRAVLASLIALMHPSDGEPNGSGCRVQMPLIPLPVSCEEFTPADDEARAARARASGEIVILCFSRFEVFGKCDFGPLLLTFDRLRRHRDRRIRLVLAGADPKSISRQIAQFAAKLGCGDAVTIQPNVSHDDKLRLLRSADIFVSPGDGVPESFGIAPVEAMACGLPCVLSDWDGYREIVLHGESGYLVPTLWTELGSCAEAFENCGVDTVSILSATTALDIHALEHYLGALIEDDQLRCAMGQRARERARRLFDWPVVVRQYDDLFDALRARARETAVTPDIDELKRRSRTQTLFSHYPSRVMAEDSAIALTDAGRQWLRAPFSLGVALDQQDLIDERLCRRIVEILARKPEASTLTSLIEQTSGESGAPAWLVRVNAMRLLKYGIASPLESHVESLLRLGWASHEPAGRAYRPGAVLAKARV
jgi:glycosyltransferase involved in cell wall biosynthesis